MLTLEKTMCLGHRAVVTRRNILETRQIVLALGVAVFRPVLAAVRAAVVPVVRAALANAVRAVIVLSILARIVVRVVVGRIEFPDPDVRAILVV